MENKYVQDLLIQSAQQSLAWDRMRLGKFTGSGISALMTEPRSKADKDSGAFSQTALKYIHEKLMEQVTGQVCYEATGRALDWGNEWEETALKELAKHIGSTPEQTKLKPSFKLFNEYSGCSPDAFMFHSVLDMELGVEIKCPFNSLNHFYHSQVVDGDTLKEINSDYYWQVQMNMLTFGKTAWIFASFDPRQPENKILHHALIEFNPEDGQLLCEKLEKAYAYKQQLVKEWTNIPSL
jgi:exodeoxyribonuclease (lambda-induced)